MTELTELIKLIVCASLILSPLFAFFLGVVIIDFLPSIYDLKISWVSRSLYRNDTYYVYKFLKKIYKKNASSFEKCIEMRDVFDGLSYNFINKKISFQQYIKCIENIFDLFSKCNLSGNFNAKELFDITETMFILEAYLWSSKRIIAEAYSSCSESDKRILCDYCLKKLNDFQNQCKQFCIDENLDKHKLEQHLYSAVFDDCEITSYIDSLNEKTVEAGVKKSEFNNLVNKYFSNKDFGLAPLSF